MRDLFSFLSLLLFGARPPLVCDWRYCGSAADPLCRAGFCTFHCDSRYGCGAACYRRKPTPREREIAELEQLYRK